MDDGNEVGQQVFHLYLTLLIEIVSIAIYCQSCKRRGEGGERGVNSQCGVMIERRKRRRRRSCSSSSSSNY